MRKVREKLEKDISFKLIFPQRAIPIMLVSVFLLAGGRLALADYDLFSGINLLSREYSASGEFEATIVTGEDDNGEPIAGIAYDSYFFSQSDPIDYDYGYDYSYEDWHTVVEIHHDSGPLSVDTYAGVNSDPWGGLPGGVTCCDGAWVNSYTTGNWDFQPQYSDMELQFDIECFQGWGELIGSIILQDLTTEALLIEKYITEANWEVIEQELDNNPFYSVDPTHTYRLTLSSRGSSYNFEGCLGGGIFADICSIPEPATVLLIGGGLVLLRKHKT